MTQAVFRPWKTAPGGGVKAAFPVARLVTVLLCACGLLAAHLVDADSGYETPPELAASMFLARESLSGPSFRVDPVVKNDGCLNSYVIHSRYGDFSAVSTAQALIRIREIAAMDAIAKLDPAAEMGKGFVGGLEDTVEGAENLFSAPVETLGQAVSGVGKIFTRAEESSSSAPSKYEDDNVKAVIGLSRTKREYAAMLGIDPYSTNPELQKRLEKIATAGYAGGLGSMGLKAAIPGGVGLAVSATSTTKWLEDVDLTVPPTDLRQQNRAKLTAMGVTKPVACAFVDNGEFTPSQQAYLVAALASMSGVGGRELFIRFVLGANSQELALYRLRLAQMFAGYHHKKARIERFVAVGRLVAGRTIAGKLVLCFPLDYFVWTQTNARLIESLAAQAAELGAGGMELWLTGAASETAARELAKRGFVVTQLAETQLLK
jgi:hypothetical protein